MWRIRRYAGELVVVLVAVMASPAATAGTIDATRAAGPRVAPSRALHAPVPCPGCWTPPLQLSWQWQLQNPPAIGAVLDLQMYDIDGFDTTAKLIDAIHARGTKAVCYISAGSWENWRPDAADFPNVVLGKSNGWPGEKWLDIRRLDVLAPIMKARMTMCRRKGFDAIEFDLVDGYQNDTGFPLSGADQLRYDVFLANQAHRRGLAAFLKNDLGQIDALLPYFDAALNEQCFQYSECGRLVPFVDAGKPVFGVEYKLATGDFCPKANAKDFNFLKKKLALDAWRVPCRGA